MNNSQQSVIDNAKKYRATAKDIVDRKRPVTRAAIEDILDKRKELEGELL